MTRHREDGGVGMGGSVWDWLRADHGRVFMWGLVWLFTLSSVAINCAHALDAMPEGASSGMVITAAVVAGFFPFAGLVMTEAVLIMIRSWRVSHWWITAMQAVLVMASMVMLVVAFWRSFNALTEMAVLLAIPVSDAWMLPVLTDTGIFVGTIGVVLAEVKMKIDGEAAVSPARSDEPVDGSLTERSTAVDELTEMARPIDRSTSQLVRSTNPIDQADESADRAIAARSITLVDHPDELAEFDSTGLDQAVHLVEQILTDRSTEPDKPVEFAPVDRSTATGQVVDYAPDEQLDRALGQRSTEQDEQPDEPVEFAPAKQSTTADEQSDEQSDERLTEPDELVDWTELAERVRSTTSITADVDDLATVLRMDATGATRAEIAQTVGRAKSTVSGWIKTAAESRPQLVAVGD